MAGVFDALYEKALAAIKDRDYERAAALFVEVIKLKPDFESAWVLRGNVRLAQGMAFEALLHFDRALELDPKLHDAWNNRGVAFKDISLWSSAEESLLKSAELMPAVDPHMNLASVFAGTNRFEKAEYHLRKALEFEPSNFEALTNLGIILLAQKRWKEGWSYYLARHNDLLYPSWVQRTYPRWQGEPLDGKVIVVCPEQGLGDMILFGRFATDLKKLGARRVIMESVAQMARLNQTIEGVDAVYLKGERSMKNAGIDYTIPVMDIPMMLGLEASDLRPLGRYLHPAPLPLKLPPGINVGLCWKTGQWPLQPETKATASNKSIPLLWFEMLLGLGVNLISLQLDNSEPELTQRYGIVTDPISKVSDLADTGSLIEHLDLVISADTAVAHLAGAMNKPVWNLVRYNGYWPWLDAWDKTEWYPSMRIYRQPTNYVWEEPLKRIRNDLIELVSKRAAA